jgi:DegV family protein with EDD domain
MAKFIISTDNVADYQKSYMEQKGIYYTSLKRIQEGTEHIDVFDSLDEYEKFYEGIKKGALPSTSQINPDEFVTHFKKILEREKTGDIIHVSISGGLSGTQASAATAAAELNPTLSGRKIYAFDSLSVSGGMQFPIDKLLELQGKNVSAEEAVKEIEKIRTGVQIFFMVDDLHHLKRGGRLSASKAFIGSILGIKPIIIVNNVGKLVAFDKAHGTKKGGEYLVESLAKYAKTPNHDYAGETIFVARTTACELYDTLLKNVTAKYPKANVKTVNIGSIVGAHIGGNASGVLFVGAPRIEKS